MQKKIIGASSAPAPRSVGDIYQEHVFFNPQGLGRQTNPAIYAGYVAPQQVLAGEPRSSGAQAQRGFEPVTLMMQGQLDVRDSAGHAHTLNPGDVLWGGAGRGVLREQRLGADLARDGGLLEQLTLWVNLPAQYKLTDPHCQHIAAAEVPEVALPDGAGTVRVIAGELSGQTGPAETVTPMQLWDVRIAAGKAVTLPMPMRWHGVLLVLEGLAYARFLSHTIQALQLVLLDTSGDELMLEVEQNFRAVLLCSQPLDEPIASSDGLVMNSEEQLVQARGDLENGLFGSLR